MAVDRMLCVSCGQTKQYPDGFPNLTYAECWRCAWLAHIRREHPKTVRETRRRVRKRARRLVEADLRNAAVGDEIALLWPADRTDPTGAAAGGEGAG